jgi:Flp pilus assembly protein TadG
VGDERGAILVFMAVILIVVLGSAGLAIDLGRGYLEQTRLARAVDASALAAARSLRQGTGTALTHGTAVASANGVVDGANGVTLSVTFGTNGAGENTVTTVATRPIPTTFMRVFGHQLMSLGAKATAAVPPVDMTMVIDQSGSLRLAGAWDELQDAAQSFVTYFDESIDQIGLVSYNSRATDRVPLGHGFVSPIQQSIQNMQSDGHTNVGEGLRLASLQLAGPAVRDRAVRVLVFFTDGRPTAFRGLIGGSDRVLVINQTNTGRVRGYFDNPEQMPSDGNPTPDGCRNVRSCFEWTESSARQQSRTLGLQEADALRASGVLIYSIGLGDPSQSDPLWQPDLDYLRNIANEGGRVDNSQPQGRFYFAPSAAELQGVFDQVAQDLVVRLSS